MATIRSRRSAAWRGASLAALLLCGAAPAALAAPADAAKLQSMQAQLDAMRAELNAMRTTAQADARITAMQAQLDAMAGQLAELKTAQEASDSEIATLKLPPAPTAVTVTLANGRPTFATNDGRFTANIRTIMMLDAGKYFQDGDLPAAVPGRDLGEGTNFRRARLGLDGKLFTDFDYAFIYEFGGSGAEESGRLYEASLTYTALRPFRIKVGAFEPNIGLAAAVSTSQMPLMERPAPAEIARNVAAGDSRIALQVMGNGSFGGGDSGLASRWFFSTAVTGNTILAAQTFDEQTGWIGRAVLAPFSGPAWQAHVGVNYQYVIHPNDAGPAATPRYAAQLRDRPELRIDGTRLIDTGAIDARHITVLGLEGGFGAGPFLIEGEWFRYDIDRRNTGAATPPDPRFGGWYVQTAWVLTGENRPYNAAEARFDAPRPTYNFSPTTGAWGAVEVAARYSVADLNYRAGAAGAPVLGAVRGGEQKVISLGANWYLNPTMRLMLDYQHVDIDRLSAAGAQIGQEYDALAGRMQVSF
ncbi:MAG: porin [Phenylobacterium zucineum]|nr:MAG: porin [Phenylobacterium zucineum]